MTKSLPLLPRQRPKISPSDLRLFVLLVFLCLCVSPLLIAQSDDEKTLFGFMNAERERENLQTLEWDRALYKVAVEHSKDMAKKEQVAHKGSDGSQPYQRIQKAGIYASKTAENVARDASIVSAHTSLMESLYHRENILDPEFTRGAVAVVRRDTRLYVTELFIRQLEDYDTEEARRLLLNVVNDYRMQHNMQALSLSEALDQMAQSHVEVQAKTNSLGRPLTMDLMAKKVKGTVRVHVYTTTALLVLPESLAPELLLSTPSIGIGYKRVRASVCTGGCYLITLVLGPES